MNEFSPSILWCFGVALFHFLKNLIAVGFINIIDGTTDGLEPTLDEGLRAQAALDAAYRAVKEHRWVKISEITGKE